MPNTPDARGRILKSASKIFAEKSFAGARIDDIAKSANVPKSLIYYHFKNKDSILETLIQDFINELKELLVETKTNDNKNKSTMIKLQAYYFKFLEERKDLVRILLIESLKEDTDTAIIFNIVEESVQSSDALLVSKGTSYDKNERLIAEFFSTLIPVSMFFCFQEKWCKHFGLQEEHAQKLFANVYEKMHLAYKERL